MAVLVWRGECPFVEKAANAQAAGAAAVIVVTDETGASLFFLALFFSSFLPVHERATKKRFFIL